MNTITETDNLGVKGYKPKTQAQTREDMRQNYESRADGAGSTKTPSLGLGLGALQCLDMKIPYHNESAY